MKVCEICGRVAYYDCAKCGKSVCDSHAEKCSKCGKWFCPDHIKRVGKEYVCVKCLSSKIMMYLGVAAVLIFIVIGSMVFIPRIRSGLEITTPEVEREWNPDMTERMIILLPYEKKTEEIQLIGVEFDNQILQNLFNGEIQGETGKLQKDEETGEYIITEHTGKLKIEFQQIDRGILKSINADGRDLKGILRWRKGYRGKENTTRFSFSIDENSYPVEMGNPVLTPLMIKEGETCTVSIEIAILENMPDASMPLRLVVKSDNKKIITWVEHPKESEISENNLECALEDTTVGPMTFTLKGIKEGSTSLTFEVVAQDGIIWDQKYSEEITVKERDKVGMEGIQLLNEPENRKPDVGEHAMYFSDKNQTYNHLLQFSVGGKGKNVVILIYSTVDYSDKIKWLNKPKSAEISNWAGLFKGENKYEILIVIPDLNGRKQFKIEFENPLPNQLDEETLGVALIKINKNGEFCDTIIEKTGGEFSSYELKIENKKEVANCYDYYSKEFIIKYQEKKEEVDDIEMIPPSAKPFSGGSSKNIFAIYLSFFIFLLSYFSLRRGGIL